MTDFTSSRASFSSRRFFHLFSSCERRTGRPPSNRGNNHCSRPRKSRVNNEYEFPRRIRPGEINYAEDIIYAHDIKTREKEILNWASGTLKCALR